MFGWLAFLSFYVFSYLLYTPITADIVVSVVSGCTCWFIGILFFLSGLIVSLLVLRKNSQVKKSIMGVAGLRPWVKLQLVYCFILSAILFLVPYHTSFMCSVLDIILVVYLGYIVLVSKEDEGGFYE